MRTSRVTLTTLVLIFLAPAVTRLHAQEDDPFSAVPWHNGPYTAHLGDIATIEIPTGFRFTDGAGASQFLELTKNPASDHELGIVMPILTDDPKSRFYFVDFEFDDVGYVKDDEKGSIPADKLLESIKNGTEEENKERQQRGWPAFHITGWVRPPFYDDQTHNLSWATAGNSEGPKGTVTNYNYETRILGRHGYMSVDLVLGRSLPDDVVPSFRTLLTGFHFTQGSRYADFVKGDKVAKYGLSALIAGGAVAIALKTGLFGKLLALLAAFWKIIAVAFAALLTRIKNIFAAFRRKPRDSDDSNAPVSRP